MLDWRSYRYSETTNGSQLYIQIASGRPTMVSENARDTSPDPTRPPADEDEPDGADERRALRAAVTIRAEAVASLERQHRGTRLISSTPNGRPMIVTFRNQATESQMPVTHQPTSRNHTARDGGLADQRHYRTGRISCG